MSGDSSIIICANSKEQTDKRNKYKKLAKEQGTFSRVVENTVVLTDGSRVSFVLGDEATEFDDEHLPPEAFDEDYQKAARDAAIAREAAREQIE
jgi:hypothetical protein